MTTINYLSLGRIVGRVMDLNLTDSSDCDACKRLQSGLAWTGKPPKCNKHSEYNTTWVPTHPSEVF